VRRRSEYADGDYGRNPGDGGKTVAVLVTFPEASLSEDILDAALAPPFSPNPCF
jgi:hypothetical protein